MRVLLLLGQNLGWRTHAATITAALDRHDDVQYELIGGGRAVGGAGRGRATAPRHRELTRAVRDVRLTGRLRRVLRERPPDVVHAAGHLMARPLLWPGVDPRRTPLSVLLDGTARQSDRAKGARVGVGRLAWREEAVVLHRAGLVSCVSEWAAHSVRVDYGVAAPRVRPYPIADPPPEWREDARERRRDASSVRLLFVGGDFERKGGPWLLDTYRRRWSEVATLTVVSDTAPTDGLPSGVDVHRGVDNETVRRRFFPAAHLLVHPTRFDQSSMVAIEAAAYSIPAVVRAVGGVGEVVQDGVTGAVAADDDAFVTAVDRLIADPPRRESMGSAARRRFLAVHEAGQWVDRLVDDWRRLLDR